MKIGQGLAWCGLVLGLWGCSGDDAGPAGDSLSCGEGTIRVGDECWPEDRVFGDDAGGSAGGDGSESSSGSNTTMMSGATDAGGTSDGGASTDSGGIGGNGSGGSGATTTDGASTDTSTASGGTSGTGGSVAATTTAGGTGGMSGSSGAGGVTSSTTGVTCSGIACQVAEDACPATSPTSLSGVVYAPSGSLPLYNVVVYVPNAPLEPLSQGLSCETCDAPLSGSPITTAITGADGSFTLEGVPSGENIPLVMQIGKWRVPYTRISRYAVAPRRECASAGGAWRGVPLQTSDRGCATGDSHRAGLAAERVASRRR